MSLVLVDSSIWIDYFREGKYGKLDQLIESDLVVTNDIILTELIPSLNMLNAKDVVDGLLSISRIPLLIDWDIIRRYQLSNLQNGINKVGIPDLIILEQVIAKQLTLFSKDKHFDLMSQYLEFKQFES